MVLIEPLELPLSPSALLSENPRTGGFRVSLLYQAIHYAAHVPQLHERGDCRGRDYQKGRSKPAVAVAHSAPMRTPSTPVSPDPKEKAWCTESSPPGKPTAQTRITLFELSSLK